MKRILLIGLVGCLPLFGFPQETVERSFDDADAKAPAVGERANSENETSGSVTVSADDQSSGTWGFGELSLGMDSASVKSVLEKSPDFAYRSFTESMLPYTELPVFECKGTQFIDRAVFQFYNDRLYSMTLFFNRKKIDFYTLFTTLTKSYGAHSDLNPRKIVWENESARLTLQKPLTLSFLDIAVHNELLGQSEIRKDNEYMRKQEFLKQFGSENNESADVSAETESGQQALMPEEGDV